MMFCKFSWLNFDGANNGNEREYWPATKIDVDDDDETRCTYFVATNLCHQDKYEPEINTNIPLSEPLSMQTSIFSPINYQAISKDTDE